MHSVFSGSVAQLVLSCNTLPHGRPKFTNNLGLIKHGVVTEVMLLVSVLASAVLGIFQRSYRWVLGSKWQEGRKIVSKVGGNSVSERRGG